MAKIRVDICSPDLGIAGQWKELIARATPNVFMDPAALVAAHALAFARIFVLLAWDEDIEPNRLVGVWALRKMASALLWRRFLAAPPFDYGFVASPVVDPAVIGRVMPAFFDAVFSHPDLPNIIELKHLDAESENYPSIIQALTARGGQMLVTSERSRPFATKDAGCKRGGSTRKKLRQEWNRLSAIGAVDIVNERSADAVRATFEIFLSMEANSWKGAGGTALLSNDNDATFARQLIANLARQGQSSVALLRVDGHVVAAQVLLYCGRMAYTWKTAFDPAFAKYSPGMLLVDRISDELLTAGEIDAIESCSPQGGFMAQIWGGRRKTIDLLVELRSRKSLGFAFLATAEHGHLWLRSLRDRLRAASILTDPKKRGLAPSR